MKDTMFFLSNRLYYLESSAEFKKVFPSIEHQSAETYSWKQYKQMNV